MSRRVKWVLIVLAAVIVVGVALGLVLGAPAPSHAETITTYYNGSFRFALAWERDSFSVHLDRTGHDSTVHVPGIGPLRGDFLTLSVVLKSPAGDPPDARGEVLVTVLSPKRMPRKLASLNPVMLGASDNANWEPATLGVLHAFRRKGTESGIVTRDYVTGDGFQVYWIRLEAASARWRGVESRLDAVAQTLATVNLRNAWNSS